MYDWRDQAGCVAADPRPGTDDTRRAIAHCHRCLVRRPCLPTALAHHLDADTGIWDATTPHTRQAMRRAKAEPAAAATVPATIGLQHTLDGDLTDPDGRTTIARLPATPHVTAWHMSWPRRTGVTAGPKPSLDWP